MGMIKINVRDGIKCGPTRTKQAFKDQVNINNIIARYQKTGMVDHLNKKKPFYGDVSEIKSYQESLEVVRKAEELFNGMSSKVRERFKNDPAQMISFLQDGKNIDEAAELGLIVKKEVKVEEVKKEEVKA